VFTLAAYADGQKFSSFVCGIKNRMAVTVLIAGDSAAMRKAEFTEINT
jgi:hypothetical protein